MAGVNKVILVGHLGADPEKRSMSNGGFVVNFRLATSEQWKDRDGNRQERTEWHNVVIFNENLGSVAERYLRKGSKCYVEGQLQTRKWQDRDGNDKYSTEVVLQKFRGEIVLLDAKRDDDSADNRSRDNDRGRRDSRDDQRDDQRGFDYREDQRGGGRDPDRRREEQRPRPQPAAFDTDLDDDVPF